MKKIIAVTSNPEFLEKIIPFVDDVVEILTPQSADPESIYLADVDSIRDNSVFGAMIQSGIRLLGCSLDEEFGGKESLLRGGFTSVVRYDDLAQHGMRAIDAGIVTGEKVLLFEPDKTVHMILENLFRSFGVAVTDITSPADAAFEEQDYSFVFANIGTRAFDINQYLKRSVASPRFKGIPFIPYRADGAVNISDIICGLNKVAKAVLTLEELYSFIVSAFVLKKVNALIGEISSMSVDGIYKSFGEMSFRTLYHQYGYEMLSAKPKEIWAGDLKRCAAELENAILCMNRHKWLIVKDDTRVTCGLGA